MPLRSPMAHFFGEFHDAENPSFKGLFFSVAGAHGGLNKFAAMPRGGGITPCRTPPARMHRGVLTLAVLGDMPLPLNSEMF